MFSNESLQIGRKVLIRNSILADGLGTEALQRKKRYYKENPSKGQKDSFGRVSAEGVSSSPMVLRSSLA